MPRIVIVASGGVLSIRSKANWTLGLGGGAVLVSGCGSGRGDSLGLAFEAGVDVSMGAVATLASPETCRTISEGGRVVPDGSFAGSTDCIAGSEAGFGGSVEALAISAGCIFGSVESVGCFETSAAWFRGPEACFASSAGGPRGSEDRVAVSEGCLTISEESVAKSEDCLAGSADGFELSETLFGVSGGTTAL